MEIRIARSLEEWNRTVDKSQTLLWPVILKQKLPGGKLHFGVDVDSWCRRKTYEDVQACKFGDVWSEDTLRG